MGETVTGKVKNVVLVGQGGVGKTMLAEAMLHLTGKTTRLGGHAGTKPTLDYDAEEGERGFSISTTVAPIIWERYAGAVNLLRCAVPTPDFGGRRPPPAMRRAAQTKGPPSMGRRASGKRGHGQPPACGTPSEDLSMRHAANLHQPCPIRP